MIPKITEKEMLWIGGGALILLALVALNPKKAGAAVGSTVVDGLSGVLKGVDDAVQSRSNTDAYKGWGIFGTLGSATDTLLGGIPSGIGGRLGSWAYDITH